MDEYRKSREREFKKTDRQNQIYAYVILIVLSALFILALLADPH